MPTSRLPGSPSAAPSLSGVDEERPDEICAQCAVIVAPLLDDTLRGELAQDSRTYIVRKPEQTRGLRKSDAQARHLMKLAFDAPNGGFPANMISAFV